jgi:hypothetical protein
MFTQAAYSLYSTIHCRFTAYSLPIHCLFAAYPLPIHCLLVIHCLFTAIHCYSLSIHCPLYALPGHCLFTFLPKEVQMGQDRVSSWSNLVLVFTKGRTVFAGVGVCVEYAGRAVNQRHELDGEQVVQGGCVLLTSPLRSYSSETEKVSEQAVKRASRGRMATSWGRRVPNIANISLQHV